MDCFEIVEPHTQLAIEVDHSAGHAKYLPEWLHVANMDVKYGGKQKVLRDSVVIEGWVLGSRGGKGVPQRSGVERGIRRRAQKER